MEFVHIEAILGTFATNWEMNGGSDHLMVLYSNFKALETKRDEFRIWLKE